MATTTRKCCGCKERFSAIGMIKAPVGLFHDIACMTNYARTKQIATSKKKQRAEHVKQKAAIKHRSKHLSEAQTAFNEYVRYRDRKLPCINTGVFVSHDGNDSDAAHFISRAANPAMRFDLRNVHKSTKASNSNQEKYIHDYRENLIKRLGEERFKQFEDDCKYWKTHKRTFDIKYLMRIKKIFRKKKRILMKLNNDN